MKRCILVLEDNQLNREPLCDWLEMEGYEIWSAADLQASYEVFSKRIPDAVLLDINLGNDDGLDLLAWMRQKPETGCKACQSKPVDFQLLREEVNLALQTQNTSRKNS